MVHRPDRHGRTCAHLLANWNADALSVLSVSGVNMYEVDGDARGVVHAAAIGGNTEGVEFLGKLVEWKHTLAEPDAKGNTPVALAITWGHFDTVKTLIGLGPPTVVSQATGKDGKCEPPPDDHIKLPAYTKMLIKEDGVLVDVEDIAKRPVHAAASKGDFAVLKRLLTTGGYEAEVHAIDEQGYTPLHWAVRGDNIREVRWLLEGPLAEEVDEDTPSQFHETPGELASRCKSLHCSRYLVDGMASRKQDTKDILRDPIASYKDRSLHDQLEEEGETTEEYHARISEYLLDLERDMGHLDQDETLPVLEWLQTVYPGHAPPIVAEGVWNHVPRRHTARRFSEENPVVMQHAQNQAKQAGVTYAVQDMAAERKETDLQSARDLCAQEDVLVQMATDQLESFNKLYDDVMKDTATLLMDGQ